jgi:hypothetical protein
MRTLATINLSDNQKRVLCKAVAAPTPKVAAQEVSNSENLIASRDQLIKLGLLNFTPNGASVTDKGMQVLKDEALVDETGQLSPDGDELAHTDAHGKPVSGQATQPPATSDVTGDELGGAPPGGAMPGAPGGDLGMGGGMEQPPMQTQSDDYERFSTLKSLLELSLPKRRKK